MSGYNELKNAIRRVVKTNNNREITGQNLQSTLTSMVNSLGANYHFAGFASLDTNPGTPDQNIFYIASEEGTYVNFDGINLEPGLSFLMWNGKWSSETISVGEVTKSWVQQNYVSIAFFNELFELYNDSTKIAVNDTIPVDKTKLNIKAMFGFWTEQYISALGKNDSGGSGSGVDMATVWSALAGSTDEQINKSHLTTALSEYATQSWVSQNFATIVSIPTKLSQLANDTGFITNAALPTKVSQLVNDAGYVTASIVNGYATQSWVSQNFATTASIPTKLSQLSNDSGYITSSGSCAYATSAGNANNADKLDGLDSDDILPYGLENLCVGAVKAGGHTTLNADGSITTDGVYGDTYFYVRCTENLTAGQIYTVGFYVTGVPSENTSEWWFPLVAQNNDNLIVKIKSNGWCWGTGTIPYDIPAGTNIIFDDNGCGFYNSINISKFVIVKGRQKPYYTPPISQMSVSSATKLQTARTIWGQSFDGTQDVNGDLILPNGKKIVIGTASLSWDADNNAVKIDGSVYATGSVSALGNSDTTGGGGGLMGSIVPYAKAITLTTQNEGAEIASAWSVKMLYDKIETIDVSGQLTSYLTKQEAQSLYQPAGNYLTGITKAQVEGVLTGNITSHTHSQYLTSHQDISGKADRSELSQYLLLSGGTISASNYPCLVLNAYKERNYICIQTNGSNKSSFGYIAGKTFIGNEASYCYLAVNDNGTPLYVNGSLDNNSGYELIHSNNIGSQSVSYASTAGSANNADMVDGYHAVSFFRDLGWWNESDSHDANDIETNGAVFAYGYTHSNVPATGTLATFVGGDYKYAWQMQRKYNENKLFVRSRNGDYNEWLQWEQLACISDITWSNVSDKPSTFAPSSHTHKWAEITDRITNVSQLSNDSGYITSSASISGNAGSATRLQTARTIWGQSFDGTSDVSGTITGATTITASGEVKALGFKGNYVADETVFYFGNSKNAIGGTDAILWAYSGHNILFYTNGSNRMTIENGGNVGIGTQSPQDKLHVVGGARVTGALVVGTSSSCDITFNRENSENFINVASGGSLLFYTYNYGTTGVILSNGNWGIGTSTPSYKLHVNGDMATTGRAIVDSLQIGNITIIYDAANKGLRIAGGGLYTDSYLSSLGVDASTALSVKKWADSIQITTESDAELATAYSIGNLYRLINSNQESTTQSLNQSVSALQGRCTSLEQRVSALENKVN